MLLRDRQRTSGQKEKEPPTREKMSGEDRSEEKKEDEKGPDVAATKNATEAEDAMSTTVVSKKDTTKQREDDPFSLKVKKGFILKSRPESLPPLSEETDSARDGKKDEKKKKRPRDARIDDGDKVCLKIIRGEECPYGDSCRFSHDIKEMLAKRPDDIATVEGGCPVFRLHGFCSYGPMCRFGSSHMNMATGENLRQTPAQPPPPPVKNVLPKDIQMQLRKKKFPFKCQRHDEKKKNKKKGDTSSSPPEPKPDSDKADMSPLPTKRKLIDFSKKVYVAPLTTVGYVFTLGNIGPVMWPRVLRTRILSYSLLCFCLPFAATCLFAAL